MAGPISTKFGTHVRIHLGMDIPGSRVGVDYNRNRNRLKSITIGA